MIMAGAVAASFGTTFVTSLMRHLEYSRSVHPDGTVARVLDAVSGPRRDVGLVYRSDDGNLRRMLVEQSEADRFVNENIAGIEAARTGAKSEASRELEAMFAQALRILMRPSKSTPTGFTSGNALTSCSRKLLFRRFRT
ncbi:MAG: hypothetical protein R3D43_03585 [Tepidamorphaceae bacterium]